MKRDEVSAARACRELSRLSPAIAECLTSPGNIWASDSSFPEPLQWNGPPDAREQRYRGGAQRYVCRDCCWQGHAAGSAEHHIAHPDHRLRGANWPEHWPDCAWSK